MVATAQVEVPFGTRRTAGFSAPSRTADPRSPNDSYIASCPADPSSARWLEPVMGYYGLLDRAPLGRNEGDPPEFWFRRHDEYNDADTGSMAESRAPSAPCPNQYGRSSGRQFR